MAKPKIQPRHYMVAGIIMAALLIVIPIAFFWAVDNLIDYQIPYKLEMLVSFWVVVFVLRGNLLFSMGKR